MGGESEGVEAGGNLNDGCGNLSDGCQDAAASAAASHTPHTAQTAARKADRGASARGKGRGRGGKAGVAGTGAGPEDAGRWPDGGGQDHAPELAKDHARPAPHQAAGNDEKSDAARAAKQRVVQAFLSRFDEARQGLGKIDVPQYAKAQRLSQQDSTLLLDSGSWVLLNHAADVAACALDETALRKLLQVELRIHMKNAAKLRMREEQEREEQEREEQGRDTDGGLGDGGADDKNADDKNADDKKRKRHEEAREAEDLEVLDQSHSQPAARADEAASGHGRPRPLEQRARSKQQASGSQGAAGTEGRPEDAVAAEHGLRLPASQAPRGSPSKRPKPASAAAETDETKIQAGASGRRKGGRASAGAKPVYVDEDSDQDMIDDDEDDDGHLPSWRPPRGRARGGGSKRGNTGGRKGDGADDAAQKQRRRRDNKLFGCVWYGAKAGGAEAADQCAHAATREEAFRQRQTVVVQTLAWRQSLVSPHLVGLTKEGQSACGRGDGAEERGSVGLLALASHQVLTLWAFSRLLPARAAPGKGTPSKGAKAAKLPLPRHARHDATDAGCVQGGVGCALVAVVTPACLRHGGKRAAVGDAVGGSDTLLAVQWLHGPSASVAVGSLNGAVDILVFRHHGGVGRVSLQEPLGVMEVAVRVSPPGGWPARHVVCCTYKHAASAHAASSSSAQARSSKGKEAASRSLPPEAGARGRGTAPAVPDTTALVVAKGRALWSWCPHTGLVRVSEDGGGQDGGDNAGNVACLTSDGSGQHVACVSSSGSISLWRIEGGTAQGMQQAAQDVMQDAMCLRLVSRMSSAVLSGSCSLLGAALSYHACYLALAGRRVIPQRGTQSLTFPTGLEGVVWLQRGTLWLQPSWLPPHRCPVAALCPLCS